MCKFEFLWFTAGLFLLLTGCAPGKDTRIQTQSTEFAPQTISSPATLIPTKVSSPTMPTPVHSNDNSTREYIAVQTAIPTVVQTIGYPVLCSPLKDETLSSLSEIVTNPFDFPPPGHDDHHHGVDFAYYRRGDRLTIEGESIQSILPGVVAASSFDRLPYGNMVIIETTPDIIPMSVVDFLDIQKGKSLYSLYAHMGGSPTIKLGEKVNCGELLGTVGTTGYDIVNPHLHLETRVGPSGATFKDMAFYDTSATAEEMDNYLRWRTSGEFVPYDPMKVFTAYLLSQSLEGQTTLPK